MLHHDACEKRKTSNAGNALFCKIPSISAGDVIQTFHHYLTAQSVATDAVLRDHVLSLDFSQLPALSEKLVLTLYLAIYSPLSSESRLRPCQYRSDIDELPRSNQNGVWTTEDLSDTHIHTAISAKRRLLERQWTVLASGICSFDDWNWADSIISSRSLGLSEARPIDHAAHNTLLKIEGYTDDQVSDIFQLPKKPNLAIVPGLDLCNHAGLNRTARWSLLPPCSPFQKTESICLIADRDITKDSEITISYGDEKSNEELFFNYAFCSPENPNWSVSVKLSGPIDLDEQQREEYWQVIAEEYGISKTIRFDRSTYDVDISTIGNPIMKQWQGLYRLKLSEESLCAILLSSSRQFLESGLVLELFGDSAQTLNPAMTREVELYLTTARDLMVVGIQAEIKRIEAAVDRKAGGSIGRKLLEDEVRGYRALDDALALKTQG